MWQGFIVFLPKLFGAVIIFIIGWIIVVVTFLWLIYRILKGWLNLYDGKPMYVSVASPPV